MICPVSFLFNRKLRSLLNKTLREDAHCAQRNMAAFAAALRRKCAPGAHFFILSKKENRKMAKEKKLVEAITSMDVDFAQWYTDVVKKAELIEYSSVKGCMVIKPAGYAIWEKIQAEVDRRFKATGVENVYMPMFIPESLLQKEKEN